MASLWHSECDLQQFVDSIDSILWESNIDACCRFTMVSKQAERVLGYPVHRWLEEPTFWVDHMHPDDQAWAPAYCAREVKRQRGHEFEYRMIAADGGIVWLHDVVSVIAERGRPIKLRGVMIDITQSKAIQEERDRLLVEERAAREEAEAAVRLRDEFLSIASHELRTPLTSMLLLFQTIRRQMDRGTAPSAPSIERAVGLVKRMAALVETLLDASRMATSATLPLRERMDLVASTREILDAVTAGAEARGCTLSLSAPETILIDADRLQIDQVLSNLLSNAVKYGAGRPIEVHLEARSSEVTLVVRDHGMGVAPVDRERIFGRLERAVSVRKFGGLGLGLFIARRIVDAHGGTIHAEAPGSGEGAQFVVTMPRGGTARNH